MSNKKNNANSGGNLANLGNINDPQLKAILANNKNNTNNTNLNANLNADLANINNLIKPNTNNTVDVNVVNTITEIPDGNQSQVIGNYFLVVAVVIALILVLLIYFFSKSYRIGRITDTMKLYQSYQTLNSFPFSKAGSIRLGDCRIASAYNCSLGGYQMLDYTSENVILATLRSGARYLEFNVFNSVYGDKADPVVSNGYKQGEWKMCLNDTLLETCFYTIANNAFSVMDNNNGVPNPDDPLFIGLNLNTNSNLACLNKIAKMIVDYFGDRLMDSKYSFQSSDVIPDIPLSKISGRVVFFCSDGFQGSKMEELVNYCWDNTDKNPKHSLQRIYYNNVLSGKITFDDLLDFNKTGLTIIVPHQEGDFWTTNYKPEPFFDSGCQFVSMNYQYIDSNIDGYITLFKNYSIVMKPEELRSGKMAVGGDLTASSGNTGGSQAIQVASSGNSSGVASQNAETAITLPSTTMPSVIPSAIPPISTRALLNPDGSYPIPTPTVTNPMTTSPVTTSGATIPATSTTSATTTTTTPVST